MVGVKRGPDAASSAAGAALNSSTIRSQRANSRAADSAGERKLENPPPPVAWAMHRIGA
jgi:hypothetical protein